MLHPSYAELLQVINADTEAGETPVVGSRYSVVLAAAKRARQITNGSRPLSMPAVDKPLSIAVDELRKGLVKIEPEGQEEDLEVSEIAEEAVDETIETTAKDAPEDDVKNVAENTKSAETIE